MKAACRGVDRELRGGTMPSEKPERRVSKKEAAQRQIHAAIELLRTKNEYECAITLANAAEGMLSGGEPRHLFEKFKERRPQDMGSEREFTNWLNETAYWLKHATEHLEDELIITEYESWVMVARAVSKYYWTFGETTRSMFEFSYFWKKIKLNEG